MKTLNISLDRKKPKKKVYENRITKLLAEVEEMKSREKLYQQRLKRSNERIDKMEQGFEWLEEQGITLKKPIDKKARQELKVLVAR